MFVGHYVPTCLPEFAQTAYLVIRLPGLSRVGLTISSECAPREAVIENIAAGIFRFLFSFLEILLVSSTSYGGVRNANNLLASCWPVGCK
jgi:hypothetical protein